MVGISPLSDSKFLTQKCFLACGVHMPLCVCGDAVVASVGISDQHVETESPDYCQLLPF